MKSYDAALEELDLGALLAAEALLGSFPLYPR